MSELQERQIAAAQELGKLEGMDNASILIKDEEGHFDVIPRSMKGMSGFGDFVEWEEIGPYLRIDDSSEWSSAKILAVAGWNFPDQSLHQFLVYSWEDTTANKGAWYEDYSVSGSLNEIRQALKEGDHELAYILAIILLQKIDNEAYLKAMQPLIEGTK